jgi:hypothetical protein
LQSGFEAVQDGGGAEDDDKAGENDDHSYLSHARALVFVVLRFPRRSTKLMSLARWPRLHSQRRTPKTQ